MTYYEVFIARGGIGMFPVELSADASCAELYQISRETINDGMLTFGGVIIPDSGQPLADYGITPECVLSLEPMPLWYSLYLFASQFYNPFAVRWWDNALNCWNNPRSANCSVEAVCNRWDPGNIFCDSNNSIVALRLRFRLELSTMRMNMLSGHLTFNTLPRTLSKLFLANHAITTVDFSGLKGKSLWDLDLNNNQIQEINLRELIGTKLELLEVAGCSKTLRKIDFEGLERTQLKWLSLYRVTCPYRALRQDHLHTLREGADLLNFHDDILEKSKLFAFSKEHIRNLMASY